MLRLGRETHHGQTHQKSVNRSVRVLKKSALAGRHRPPSAAFRRLQQSFAQAPSCFPDAGHLRPRRTSGREFAGRIMPTVSKRFRKGRLGLRSSAFCRRGLSVAFPGDGCRPATACSTAAHSVCALLVRQVEGPRPLLPAPARWFGRLVPRDLAWFYLRGGGQELYRELTQDELGLDVGRLPRDADARPTLSAGSKEEVSTSTTSTGFSSTAPWALPPTFSSRWVCRSRSFPGGEIVPAHGARGHRRVRVQQPDFGPSFSAPMTWAKNYYMSSYHQAFRASSSSLFQRHFLRDLDPDLQGDPPDPRFGGRSLPHRAT